MPILADPFEEGVVLVGELELAAEVSKAGNTSYHWFIELARE
jgi:hypothetical protein